MLGTTDPPSPETTVVPRDGRAHLDERSHTYFIDGEPLQNSVTKIISRWFPKFDGLAVATKHFEAWESDRFCKYYQLIRYLTTVQKLDRAECIQSIVTLWQREGALASQAGTAMHLDFECIVKGRMPPQGETHEVKMFRTWLSTFCETYNVAPFRSEWVVFYTQPPTDASTGLDDPQHAANPRPVVAGQIDLVLKHREREQYWCVDFKNKNPAPKYKGGPAQLLGDSRERAFECGTGPFANLPATDFAKYTAQLNAYGYIAAKQYDIDFRDRMFVLQVHEALAEPHLVRVERLDAEMDELFALEAKAAQCVRAASP